MATFEPMFDHQYHGKNVTISDGGKMAEKIKRGGRDALVVTNRPLWNNELLEVEIGSCSGSSGHSRKSSMGKKASSIQDMKGMFKGKEYIRVGITTHCPADLFTNQTPCMKRMNSGTWLMKGEDVIENGEPLMTYAKYNLKELAIADRVGLMRLPEFNGSLVIFINGEAIGIVATGIPEKMYGFIELQNDCDRICITKCHGVKLEALPIEIRSLREKDAEIRNVRKQLVEKDELIQILEGQMETLRRQLMSSRVSQGSHSSSEKETRETQTGRQRSLSPGKSGSPTPIRRRKKPACCVIS